jgi:hypothetical protein
MKLNLKFDPNQEMEAELNKNWEMELRGKIETNTWMRNPKIWEKQV